ncbi:eCIS core domain-containing protein [Hymenobacter ruricola]|uniref:DUF4157 domain-containing protein n=1 Tax=Hymenobacter ruricola TaxID=2791023 RepID=A0ABS0I7E6_9BACT|nr:DUF4157 domain-containing protein [Hymenobacter ruricola]MBF9222681.1 DUF4157 domain-containing protein [Hymenobacter ruricola]
MKKSASHRPGAPAADAQASSQAQAQADERPAAVAQRQTLNAIANSPRQVAQRQQAPAALPARNATGLPDQLKAGVEQLSGHSLDDVRVHRNSAKPGQLQAHAYAQGSEIHVAPGQEQHLPHEAWHVVQQKEGRVKPTMQLRGVGINDDAGLEREASQMGERALVAQPAALAPTAPAPPVAAPGVAVQRHFDGHPSPEMVAFLANERGLEPDQVTALVNAARDLTQNFGPLENYLQSPGLIGALPQPVADLAGPPDTEMQEEPQPVGLGTAPPPVFAWGGMEMASSVGPEALEERTSGSTPQKKRPITTAPRAQKTVSSKGKGNKHQKSWDESAEINSSPVRYVDDWQEPNSPQQDFDFNQTRSEEDYQQQQAEEYDNWEQEYEDYLAELGAGYGADGEQASHQEEREEKQPHLGQGSQDEELLETLVPTVEGSKQPEEERQTEAQEEGSQKDEELTDDEEEAEVFNAARELQVVSFGENDVQVLTEKFQHKGVDRRRPVEWKIPFTKWGGGAQGKGRTTPTPMSLFSVSDDGQSVMPDQDFDEEGRYQKGHMVPASSGAHNHYALTTPMEQHTNQVGAWKKTEEAIDRILLKPNRGSQTARPKSDAEESLALVIQGFYNAKDPDEGRGFVHINAQYKGSDGRIPSSYRVKLFGVGEGEEVHLLHTFEGIKNEYSAENRNKMPSDNLRNLFRQMDAKMRALDQRALAASKQGQRHPTDTQWTPLAPETDSLGKARPARGIPEKHVPRPHRALDVLVEELRNLGADRYQQVLDTLTEEEQDVVHAAVGTAYGGGQAFNWAQRDLAERHARHLDPDDRQRFLSDTRSDVTASLADDKLRDMYTDSHAELQHGGGGKRPEADHHVPRSTGSGTNFFSNLLWVSHDQNLSAKAQNKPVNLLNPHRVPPSNKSLALSDDQELDDNSLGLPSKKRGKPSKQALSTVAKGGDDPETVTEDTWDEWQAETKGEGVSVATAKDLDEWATTSYSSMRKDAEQVATHKMNKIFALPLYKKLLVEAEKSRKDDNKARGVMPWDIIALSQKAKMEGLPKK